MSTATVILYRQDGYTLEFNNVVSMETFHDGRQVLFSITRDGQKISIRSTLPYSIVITE